jgi:hypothetical protein
VNKLIIPVALFGFAVSYFTGMYRVSWETFFAHGASTLFVISGIVGMLTTLSLRQWRKPAMWRDIAIVVFGIPASVLATAILWRIF